jgi:uncharacterized protein (TIGR02246 family)
MRWKYLLSRTLLLAGLLMGGCAPVTLEGAAASSIAEAAAPSPAVICQPITEDEVARLFDRWNASLQSGDPAAVAANYTEDSILLPTRSNKPRLTAAEKEEYFQHFLENSPSGSIDLRHVDINCNQVVDSGLYTFTFAKTGTVLAARYTFTYGWDGTQWLITSHHSSAMPEP